MQRGGRRSTGWWTVAMVVVGVTSCVACSGDDADAGDGGTTATTTTTTADGTTTTGDSDGDATTTLSTVVQAPVEAASTGTGPVDGEHPCGALSVAEVAAAVPGVAGARRNGTSCFYATQAGEDALQVDLPPTRGDTEEASLVLISITFQFDPSFEPSGLGCDPVDLGPGATTVEEAYYCTRSSGDSPATLVLRSGTTVVQLIDVVPSTPPDQARLVTLAQTLRPRLP